MLYRTITVQMATAALVVATAGCERKTDSSSVPAKPAMEASHNEQVPAPAAAHPGHEADHSSMALATRPAITQKTCPVMGGEIDPEVYLDHAGRRVYFCCEPCKDKFKADPAKYLVKLDVGLSASTKPAS